MVKLDRICRDANVLLIFARSYGLTGLVRISLKVTCLCLLLNFVFPILVFWKVRIKFLYYIEEIMDTVRYEI